MTMAAEQPSGVARHLPRGAWRQVLRRTVREFQEDRLTDEAAALTYYGVLSIFPGLIVLVSALGLLGSSAIDNVKSAVREASPGQVGEIFNNAIDQVRSGGSTASVAAVLGLLVAFWSASGYVGAFMRAANAIYEVPEGRPLWKTLPIRIAVTAAVGFMLVASLLIVVFTGELATQAGELIGAGATAVTVWSIAKWPVLVVLVGLILAILYWASPNVRRGGFRWASPGAFVAVTIWLVASGLFAVYVANFASYNKTYGSLATAVVFLVWLWITNLAVLFGAELDAELERGRAIAAGHPEDEEPFLQLRDDRKVKKNRSTVAS
jgi:membrane protein